MVYLLKSVVLGDGAIGKTTLLHRWIKFKFVNDVQMTIGVNFHTYDTRIKGQDCKLIIWDLGGQDRFQKMGVFGDYLIGASSLLLGFDLTSTSSFENALGKWIDLIKKYTKNVPIVIFGNKYDLKDERSVEESVILAAIKDYGFKGYYETSAKTGLNVKPVFDTLIKEGFRFYQNK